jgi:predicted Zn-dependent protease
MILVATATAAASAQDLNQLPELGDYSTSVVSSAEEQKLGREFMRDARRSLTFIEDPELNDYLNHLGQRLAANSNGGGVDFSFYLVKDPALNAFAVPGGHISVHTGLILATRHESELASVLAHEVAHITQRHLPRMLAAVKSQTIPMTAAIIAAILLGGQVGQAALAATNASLIERQLRYSREFEREADTIGIRALARSGFDPRSMPQFFERMQQWARVQESNAPEFLRTHPLTTDRIAESISRAERYPPASRSNEEQFLHMRAKIRALYNGEPQRAVTYFASALEDKQNTNARADRFGYALALMASSQYDRAREQIQSLVKSQPQNPSYRIAEAEVEMSAGNHDRAVELYSAARQEFANLIVFQHYIAAALLKSGRHQDAKQVIRQVMLKSQAEPKLYAMLARAEGELKNPLAAYQALAEYHYLMGNPREALRQLQLARNYVGDSFYARASIDARVTEIEQQLRLAGEKVTSDKPSR